MKFFRGGELYVVYKNVKCNKQDWNTKLLSLTSHPNTVHVKLHDLEIPKSRFIKFQVHLFVFDVFSFCQV